MYDLPTVKYGPSYATSAFITRAVKMPTTGPFLTRSDRAAGGTIVCILNILNY